MLSNVAGIAFDGGGNLLVADQGNSRIRMITPAGTITTIAGNGSYGYSGDGGPATQASLFYPIGVSVSRTGKIYIADSSNYVIRMVDKKGIIKTVAGNHTAGFSGDGGKARSAQIQYPYGVVADTDGSFYIADSSNYRIRRVDSKGIINTYAGNGQSGNQGDGGPATQASIGFCQGLTLGGGKLYIATSSNIWAVAQATGIINLMAGTLSGATGFIGDGGPALSASFSSPRGMTLDANGTLQIADSANNRIRAIDASQNVTTTAGGFIGDGGPARSSSLGAVFLGGHMGFDSAGNLYFADTNNHRVRKVSTDGSITTVAGTGISGYSGDGGPATAAMLNTPQSVVVDGSGNLFIGDTNNGSIRKVDTSGTITTFVQMVNVPAPWGGYIQISVSPYGMAIDRDGNIYAASFNASVILKIAPDASATIAAGVVFNYGYNGDGIPANQAFLLLPNSVTLDGAGNLYIADWLNQRIRKVDTNGIIWTLAGNGQQGYSGDGGPATNSMLSLPLDMAADAKGNIYIADSINERVRVVDSTGTINTLAGTGIAGYNGNGLPADQTNLFPVAVTTNSRGIVYVMDDGSARVRKVH